MRPARILGASLLSGLLLTASRARAQAQTPSPQTPAPLVESVDVSQNQFLQKETILYYVSTKPGDRYDERRVREDFHRLWETGFLDDLIVDVLDTPQGGKKILFVVQERKRVQIIDYRGSKELSTTNIEDKLKEKEAGIKLDTFFDLGKVRRIEAIIRDMLHEKGRPFGTVKHDEKVLGGSGLQISFIIEDGPDTKVREIAFQGNHVFSDGTLKRRMKKIKERGFWNLSWITGKSTYTDEKWQEDQEAIRDFYLDHGYVTATVGRPAIKYIDGTAGFFHKHPAKWIRLEVPVSEGDQYRVGEVKFEGLTVFKPEQVRPIFKLETGEVYRDSALKKGYEKLRDIYGQLGYFQWTGFTKRQPDAARRVVDLNLVMEEDKKYYIGKIRFTGNDTTRDKVVRREVFMNEGDPFNTEALKFSIRRLNQLGYFRPVEAPQFGPSSQAEDKLDITFKLEEQNRNQFTFGGGVSGLEGAFVNASFSTANFLGLGETLQLSAQSGARTKNFQIGITEPYLFDRNITAGFNVFTRKIIYNTIANVVGFTQGGTGLTLTTGYAVGRFTRMFTSYSYEIVNISAADTTSLATPTTTAVGTAAAPLFDPFLFGEAGTRRESRFNPSIVRNTVDSPWTPRTGSKQSLNMVFAGGPLGGTLSYLKPDLEVIYYVPQTKYTALGVRAEVAMIAPYGDTARLPLYQRFFMGGENQIRGYDIRTVGPVDSQNRALGGNKFALFNAEYYIDIGGPLRFVLFFDAGQAFLEGEMINVRKFRTSTGAEFRFVMPVLNVPFRLIYAINPNRDLFQPRSTFKFSVGTTF